MPRKKTPSQLDAEIAEALTKPAKPKRPPTWKQMAARYKRDAESAKAAGGRVKTYPYGAISILPVEGADEWYYEDWQYDELMEKTKRDYPELLKYISIEDLLLAQSQHW